MVLPNFLIVGAAKCGTTSAYEYLKSHPQVFMPEWKEPSYFADVPKKVGLFRARDYEDLFAPADRHVAVGEASVSYLFEPNAAKRIAYTLGADTKIIIFIRNPIQASHSLWMHNKQRLREDFPFEIAITKEEERRTNERFKESCAGWVGDYMYLSRYLYYDQIERFVSVFGAENVRVYVFEEFFRPGLPLYPDLCEFLNIDSSHKPQVKIHNQSGQIRSRLIRDMLVKRSFWKEPLKILIPENTRKKLKSSALDFNVRKQKRERIDPSTHMRLQEYFRSDVMKLQNSLGIQLSELWFGTNDG